MEQKIDPLVRLVEAAPFGDDMSQQLIAALPTMLPSKRYELENACWDLLKREFQNRINYELTMSALQAATQGMAFQDRVRVMAGVLPEYAAKIGVSLDKTRQMLTPDQPPAPPLRELTAAQQAAMAEPAKVLEFNKPSPAPQREELSAEQQIAMASEAKILMHKKPAAPTTGGPGLDQVDEHPEPQPIRSRYWKRVRRACGMDVGEDA